MISAIQVEGANPDRPFRANLDGANLSVAHLNGPTFAGKTHTSGPPSPRLCKALSG